MTAPTIDSELCVVGAGIAGLNALHSASCYLEPSDRVALVDSRDAPGGMWCDTYNYVRLHQPHRLFTVGDIPWAEVMPPPYLANRNEVQRQFGHCLAQLRRRVDLVELFGHRYVSHREQGGDRDVEIACERFSDGSVVDIHARRLIKAVSNDIQPSRPLPCTSEAVRSFSPHELDAGDQIMARHQAPVVIAGGGKTAMDTAHYLIERNPERDIRLIVGSGVMFMNRDRLFPTGLQRWFGGHTIFEMLLDTVLRFDGSNTGQAMRRFRETYALAANEHPQQFLFGAISGAEMDTIRSGVCEIIEDRFEDVVDGADGPVLLLGSGASRRLPAGAWIVNCTGYLPADADLTHEPYISAHGKVLSINPTSLVFFLSSFSGYFLTHLFYRGELSRLPLYQAPGNLLMARAKDHAGMAGSTMTVLNLLQVMQVLPLKLINACRLDLNRWYPLPRRLPMQLQYMLRNDRYQAHCRTALDRLSAEVEIPIGPLPHIVSNHPGSLH